MPRHNQFYKEFRKALIENSKDKAINLINSLASKGILYSQTDIEEKKFFTFDSLN
jgi:hypothetical protein